MPETVYRFFRATNRCWITDIDTVAMAFFPLWPMSRYAAMPLLSTSPPVNDRPLAGRPRSTL